MNKKITPKSTSKISPITRAVIMTFALTSGIFFLVWFIWLREPTPALLPDRPLMPRVVRDDASGSSSSGVQDPVLSTGTMISTGMTESGLASTGRIESIGPISPVSTGTISASVTGSTSRSETATRSGTTRMIDPPVCPLDYAPVCGADAQTYSNDCMAHMAHTIVAYDGACSVSSTTGVSSVSLGAISTGSVLPPKKVYSTGASLLYTNRSAGYTIALPKYSYYAGGGARDGAVHSLAVSTTSTGAGDFVTAEVQVWFYPVAPANPPSSRSVQISRGMIYVANNSSSVNPKVEQIIQSILESAE